MGLEHWSSPGNEQWQGVSSPVIKGYVSLEFCEQGWVPFDALSEAISRCRGRWLVLVGWSRRDRAVGVGIWEYGLTEMGELLWVNLHYIE